MNEQVLDNNLIEINNFFIDDLSATERWGSILLGHFIF